MLIHLLPMIRGYEAPRLLEPAGESHFQFGPAITAGLIGGALLLLAPSGSPWSGITFFSPVIMGRTVPPEIGMPLIAVWLVHLVLAFIYGLIISRVVAGVRRGRAIFAGAVVGLLLYFLNFGCVSAFWPSLRGNEPAVLFAHVFFSMVAAGAYRGLLRRTATLA